MLTSQEEIAGLSIHLRWWLVDEPKQVVVAVHGMGTHGGRFDHIARHLNSQGINFISYDQPGHGLSEGKRGHISKYRILLDTLDGVIALAKKTHPEIPLFLLAHSMGANIAANYVIRYQPKFNGVILSAPWFKLAFNPPFLKMMLGKMLINFWPSIPISAKLNANYISHDPEVLDAYDKDMLIHQKITPAFFFALQKAGLVAVKKAKQFQLPLYIYQGTADHITSIKATIKFAGRVPQAKFKAWENCYHEVHNEWVRSELYQDIISFIEEKS